MTSNATPDRPQPRVLVVGDVMLDVIARPRRPIELATDTPAEVRLMPGGSGANQAAWLGYLGHPVTFAGRVGRAQYDVHAGALRAFGVVPSLGLDDDAHTGTLVTLIGIDGERTFITDRGANRNLTRADLADALLDGIGWLHVSGYTLFEPGPRSAVRDFVAAARARAVPFSIDCGSAGFLRETGNAAFLTWTNGAAVIFANAGEAATITGTDGRDEQLARLASHAPIVVVTDGVAGARAFAARSAAPLFARAAPCVTATDTTGAGDAFVAGFLRAHLRAAALEACLRAGVAAGSLAVTHAGGRPRRE